MEPVPESAIMFELLEQTPGGGAGIADLARRVLEIVPDLVGISVTFVDEGLTMTLVASDSSVATLDALQFLDGGPCDAALRDGRQRLARPDDPLDEAQWQFFRAAETQLGVESSLSMPVSDHGVISCVNLYGGTTHAFDGRVDAVADAIGSTPALAISNADLSFSTRLRAATSAALLEEDYDLDVASGIVAGRHGITPAEALERLRMSAARADVPLRVLARVVIDATAS